MFIIEVFRLENNDDQCPNFMIDCHRVLIVKVDKLSGRIFGLDDESLPGFFLQHIEDHVSNNNRSWKVVPGQRYIDVESVARCYEWELGDLSRGHPNFRSLYILRSPKLTAAVEERCNKW